MTAAAGTIPSLPQYQPGALPLAGTEAFEIVNTTNATAALSYFLLVTDAVGKAPGVMSSANPGSNDLLAFYRPSTGLYFSTPIGNLSLPAGNLPVAGSTGQILQKNSTTNYDASWVNLSASVAGQTSVVTVTGSTSLVVGIATAGIGSTQLGTNAVQTNNIATGAVIGTTIAAGAINSSHLSNFAIFSTAIATGQVGPVQLANFAVSSAAIATGAVGSTQLGAFAVVAGAIATGAVGSTQLGAFAVQAGAIATGAVGATQISTAFYTTASVASTLAERDGSANLSANTVIASAFLESLGGFKRATTSFSTATTTLANVGNLTVSLLTNTAYQFDAVLFATAGSTGGAKIAVAYTGTATSAVYEMVSFNTALLTEIYTTTLGAALTAATSATTPCIRIVGNIVASTAGTLAIQIAQQASTSTSTVILAGSTLRVFQMA